MKMHRIFFCKLMFLRVQLNSMIKNREREGGRELGVLWRYRREKKLRSVFFVMRLIIIGSE